MWHGMSGRNGGSENGKSRIYGLGEWKVEFRLGGIVFRNPVFLASGPAGYGIEYSDFIDLTRLGGVVTKTITFEPRQGNPGRRIRETESGLLNSVGLENVGARRFFAEKLQPLIDAGVKPIVSLAAEDWSQYRRLVDFAALQDNADVVEINLSCPNVERGGMAVGINPDLVGKYIHYAKDILTSKVVLAKLTPNVADIADLALAAEEAGADGITAINTVLAVDIDTGSRKPVFQRISAGLSGPAIFPIALGAIWKISKTVNIPVIGVGGISSVADASKFFMAGASAVQVGTAIFYDPGLPERIVETLAEEGSPTTVPDVSIPD